MCSRSGSQFVSCTTSVLPTYLCRKRGRHDARMCSRWAAAKTLEMGAAAVTINDAQIRNVGYR
ncbi:uncharacterized protein LY79DRAFT_532192 [Colletotrichum navitas]|uniref:Uncharacterized protein n=1 Tax=Colletotrichum navitas TaxID=681940 RepID=A0AAD8VCD5_9PEZI|nr:uncharacterized protein LY79DRAFT_532192 [Colletotrichum navitas]KAK1599988.1 hypothetical protein LY79DRAFT_532192 [Colletotrichum navitas]